MSEQQPYEGKTTRLPQYTAPAASGPPTATEDEPIFAPRPQHRHRPLLVIGGIVVLAALVGGSGLPFGGGFVERTAADSAQFEGATNLRLDVGSGNVTIVRGDDDEIAIEMLRHGFGWTGGAAQRSAERLTPAITQAGDTVEIAERRLGSFGIGRSPYVDYRITVPDDAEVYASAGSGDVSVSEIGGPLELRTGSGNITLSDVDGRLIVDAGSGNIQLAGGTVDRGRLQTGSGEITVEDVRGIFEAHTGSGNIVIENADDVQVELQTGSGNIRFDGSLDDDGGSRAETGSGNISLRLPDDTDARVEAQSSSGRVSSDWDLAGDNDSRTGTIGSGGAELKLHTGSGNIEIEQD